MLDAAQLVDHSIDKSRANDFVDNSRTEYDLHALRERSIENPIAGWLLYHFASGQSFFTGISCVLIAVILATRTGGRSTRWVHVLCGFGVVSIALSSTPLPVPVYLISGLALGVWWFPIFTDQNRRRFSVILLAMCVALALSEARYHLAPNIHVGETTSFAFLGDSLTAGFGDSDESVTWATLLARDLGVEMQDYSQMGATVGSTCERLDFDSIDASLVLVELGGNDILGTTSPAAFEQDLERLMTKLFQRERTVIMFELPLPPSYHRYGLAQRKIARRYDVPLIPKRVLLGVITSGGATIDSIHLTQAGHSSLAVAVGGILHRPDVR